MSNDKKNSRKKSKKNEQKQNLKAIKQALNGKKDPFFFDFQADQSDPTGAPDPIKKSKIPKKTGRLKKILLWILLIGSSALILWIFFLWLSLQKNVSKITNYEPILTTQIIDRKGRLVANIYQDEFRFYSNFSEIPPRLIEALLAIEDTLFFEHSGLNYDAILRASIKNIYRSKYSEGGSTLTQQLVKNLALTRNKTLLRKLKEAIISLQIERILTKEQILERYLNDTFFGHGYYGIKAASLGYFRKDLNQLTLKEMALLAALPRAPSYYDPTKNIHLALSRANNVIDRMLNLGWISKAEYSSAISEIPKIYNQNLAQNKAPYIVDMVLKELSYIPDLKTGGYVVKLNIDLDYQEIAQKVIKAGYLRAREINNLEDSSTLNGAMVVTNNSDGRILALVGGVDYSKSAFNRATQARRQIGSIIKPFIYQIAFDNGYSPASQIPDVARSYGSDDEIWKPKNVGNAFNGIVRLRYALIHSLNLATLNLVDAVGFDKVLKGLLRYGFNITKADMTLALGSMGQSPLQMARAYSLFSNDGMMLEPFLINEINKKDKYHEVFTPKSLELESKEQAFLVRDLLQNAVRSGTGRRAQVPGLQIAGKTGTTNNNNDAWFAGFSPEIQVILWFGNDDNTPIGKIGGGTSIVAPIFSSFMREVLKIHPEMKRRFQTPDNVHQKSIGGIKYFYTDTSKLPDKSIEGDGLIF